jgi:hypothetical protein
VKNFDGFIGIDWSGARTPEKTQSIAVAIVFRGDDAPHLSGKLWSRQMVYDWLLAMAKGKKRFLVGIDCNFGYSAKIGVKQFGKNYTAHRLWQNVEQICADTPNFFAGPFWEHPSFAPFFWTSGTRPNGLFLSRRETENACGQAGLGWPESPFKLIGAKQVGKGGLAGMRLVHRLKAELGDGVAVWPFDEGIDKAMMVITEIYPRLFLRLSGHGSTKIRDIAQLNVVLGALGAQPYPEKMAISDHQADALVTAAGLRKLCGTDTILPEALVNIPIPKQLLQQEGWIFGVGST